MTSSDLFFTNSSTLSFMLLTSVSISFSFLLLSSSPISLASKTALLSFIASCLVTLMRHFTSSPIALTCLAISILLSCVNGGTLTMTYVPSF